MFRMIAFFIKMFFYLIKSLPPMKKALKLDKQGLKKERDELIFPYIQDWAGFCIRETKSTVEVRGIENLPQSGAMVFIGNHQGNMDIPILLSSIPRPIAFISKIEILKIPIISKWMKLMQCVFLDRKSMKKSVEAMHEAVEKVKEGYSMVIFPEGTRSKGGPVKDFKAGSFKLAFQAEAPIVPVTIDGSWRIYEEHKSLRSGKVTLTIHPAVNTKGLTKEEQQEIPKKVRETVVSALS